MRGSSAAGKSIAVYKRDGNELVQQSKYNTLPEKVGSMKVIAGHVFAVIGKQLRKMSPQGPSPDKVDVRFSAIGSTYDEAYLVVITASGVTFFDTNTLQQVATSPLERQDTILSIGPSTQKGRVYLGTRSGELYQCTYD